MSFEHLTEQEILAIANPIMDNLMDASSEINHAKHVQVFTERLKGIVTEDYLKQVCKTYQSEKGNFFKREVVAVFKRPESAAVVWRQYFTKAQGEFVAEMVLVKVDGQYQGDHVMVF
ncbi:hypothetical protein [Vibrio sp. WXL210]|uniref:hypothetical protein n=1 Tax=Vibrio sp. WXL210 TaxID=3450709 RepID=UPI003EC67890